MKPKLSDQITVDSNGNTRPRAHSAPVVSLLNTRPRTGGPTPNGSGLTVLPGGGSPHPALRKISQNGLTTSFYTAGNSPYYQRGSRASIGLHGTRLRTISICSRKESLEMRCCRINVLLVTMQLCLGTTVTALGFYMETITPSISIRECPYWAGIPTLLAGVLGIYFCATDFAAYQGSTKAFVIKCICFTLSAICVFLCMIASVFPGIHGNRISSFAECNVVNGSCQCVKTLEDPYAPVYIYLNVITCDMVITSIKDYFILQCALNAIASGVCFWFVTLLWKSRYQTFYSGVRFYPYSTHAHTTRQWAAQPPQTYANGHPPSPICVKKSRAPSKRALEYGEQKPQEIDAQEPLQCEQV